MEAATSVWRPIILCVMQSLLHAPVSVPAAALLYRHAFVRQQVMHAAGHNPEPVSLFVQAMY